MYWAAHHRRREVYVGTPAAVTIVGNKIAPAFGDWYLGKTGYKSAQTSQPADPDRPDNLWDPVPGDWGAHGPFDDRSYSFSPQLWATTHRSWLLVGVAAAALGGWYRLRGRH